MGILTTTICFVYTFGSINLCIGKKLYKNGTDTCINYSTKCKLSPDLLIQTDGFNDDV